jgi:hypothetical protein
MVCSDEDRGRNRRPGAEDRGWSHRSRTRWPSGREVGWRRVWSAPGTWRSVGFLVEPQNQGRRFESGLASKPLGQFSLVWLQNQWRQFSPVWPQNWWRWFIPVWLQNRWWVSWLSLKTKVVEGSSHLAFCLGLYIGP